MMELGLYTHLGHPEPFHIERLRTVLVGKGKGKSTTLTNLALQEHSFTYIGDCTELVKRIPKRHQSRVLYVSPYEAPFALNLLADVSDIPSHATALTNAIVGLSDFDIDPVRIKKYLSHGLQTLLQAKNTSLLSLQFLLTSDSYRKSITSQLKDPVLKDFWENFERKKERDRDQETESTLTRLYALSLHPAIRRCLDQEKNKLVFKNKIVLVHLGKSEQERLLGALIIATVKDTVLYVDGDYGSMEVDVPVFYTRRKLDLTYDSVEQVIAFRTSVKDSKVLKPELHVTDDQAGPQELPDFTCYVEYSGRAIEVTTHPLPPVTLQEDKIRRRCQSQCTQPIEAIDKRMGRFFC